LDDSFAIINIDDGLKRVVGLWFMLLKSSWSVLLFKGVGVRSCFKGSLTNNPNLKERTELVNTSILEAILEADIMLLLTSM